MTDLRIRSLGVVACEANDREHSARVSNRSGMEDSRFGFRYSAAIGDWEPERSSPPLHISGSGLSCLTWNVWFDDYAFEDRAQSLLWELREQSSDLIALQEVTPRLLAMLAKSPWVRSEYILSEHEPDAMESYGCLLLSRSAPRTIRRYPLPSKMKRYAVIEEFDTPEGTLSVATVHLESMKFLNSVRGEQLQALFAELERFSEVILMGDFNFCSSWVQENDRLDGRYLDLWSELHPGEPGYTEDTAVNSMRLARKKKEKQVRFDRILLRDDRGKWRPQRLDLLGCQELGPELFISDHFGLRADLVPASENTDILLMLGKDHGSYGVVFKRSLGGVTACLSVGSDPASPSLAFKADKKQPNEDALLVRRHECFYLLAVSDAHFGIESSHRLLERLSSSAFPLTRLDLLKLCLEIQKPHEQVGSGATLVVALYDEGSGQVLAYSTGDSTLAVLDETGWKVKNEPNTEYIRLDRVSYPDSWYEMEFCLEAGAVLVLHTDGVDECHYRRPETSLRAAHVEALWADLEPRSPGARIPLFCSALVRAALDGVDGHPGGQDNIALLAIARE